MITNITHKNQRLEVPTLPLWRVAALTIILIICALGWAFVAFHFTVKLTIWYAKLRGWL